jgi:hypothetical protein
MRGQRLDAFQPPNEELLHQEMTSGLKTAPKRDTSPTKSRATTVDTAEPPVSRSSPPRANITDSHVAPIRMSEGLRVD